MRDNKEKQSRQELKEEYLWPLALSYLKRADDVANYLRALLFALSGGAIGLIFTRLEDNESHAIAILFFAVAIAFLIASWDMQKTKAGKRFETLRDHGYGEYRKWNIEVRNKRRWRNYIYDRVSFLFIFLGFLTEAMIWYFGRV